MKIPNKQQLQQIATNYSSDIDFDEFKKLYRNFTVVPFSFLLIATTLLSNYALCFQKNLLGGVKRVVITIYEKS